MQWAFELISPESQETLQFGEIRVEIVVLPDIGLEKPKIIRSPIQNASRGEPVSL
jgi:hypothetical protein